MRVGGQSIDASTGDAVRDLDLGRWQTVAHQYEALGVRLALWTPLHCKAEVLVQARGVLGQLLVDAEELVSGVVCPGATRGHCLRHPHNL